MMNFFKKLSVRLKISLSFLFAVLVIVVFILIFFPAKQANLARKSLEDKATSISKMLAVNVAPGLEFDDTDMVNEAFVSAAQDEDLSFIVVFNPQKEIFAAYNFSQDDMKIISNIPEGKTALENDMLIVNIPIISSGQKVGSLALGMSLARINRQIVKYRLFVILGGIIILILAAIAGTKIGKMITNPLESVKERAVAISQRAGDLTTHIPVITDDEVGELGTAFNNMLEGLRVMILKVLETANDVSELVKQLTVSYQDIGATTEEVSATIQEISTSTAKTAKRVEETTYVIEEMTNNVVALVKSSQQAVNKMNAISNSVTETMEVIEALASYSEKIGEFVNVISDIANQTNLLALNASIEAARAGEAGRGFTVVAEEVKKLAEDSGEAANQISKLIGDITNKINTAVDNMRASVEKVEEGKKVISSVSEQIRDVVSAGAHSVEGKITEIAAMSENAASATEETSAATEEITSSMEQMNTLIEQLYNRAAELKELVGKFKVKE
ncbi:hypothetical protein DRQ26_00105 [bacterium]|nr:MAG: hypothetical protein DRQ26_00105 [bacterium]